MNFTKDKISIKLKLVNDVLIYEKWLAKQHVHMHHVWADKIYKQAVCGSNNQISKWQTEQERIYS